MAVEEVQGVWPGGGEGEGHMGGGGGAQQQQHRQAGGQHGGGGAGAHFSLARSIRTPFILI